MSEMNLSSLADAHVPQIEGLDLTAQGVYKHFVASGDQVKILSFLLSLDRMDRWAVDFDEMSSPETVNIQLYLEELLQFLQTSSEALHKIPREFAEVLAHLTSTRCMYVLRYVSQHNTQFLDALAYSIGSDEGKDPHLTTIKRRFEVFSRARLLGDIFSGARLSRIVSIMNAYHD